MTVYEQTRARSVRTWGTAQTKRSHTIAYLISCGAYIIVCQSKRGALKNNTARMHLPNTGRYALWVIQVIDRMFCEIVTSLPPLRIERNP